MRSCFALLLTLAAAGIGTAGPDDDALALLHLAAARQRAAQAAPSVRDVPWFTPAEAAKTPTQPVVVFVNLPGRLLAGCSVYEMTAQVPRILYSLDGSKWYGLEPYSSDAEILQDIALRRKAVSQPQASFFGSSSNPQGQGVDAKTRAAGPQFHPSHQCPSCGRSQYAISGAGPTRGTHTHTCRNCGTQWFH